MKSRKSIYFILNSKAYEVTGEQCFLPLADFLRYERSLTGTKIVCAEGDCGACTVLLASVHEFDKGLLKFKAVNACILPLFAIDACQILSVEALKYENSLHPVQTSMLNQFASQCGYCTPGFVCAMTSLLEDSILNKKTITEKRAKNYMTGNLCRCTGYDPILKAAMALPLNTESLQKRFSNAKQITELKKHAKIPVEMKALGVSLFLPTNLKQAMKIKMNEKAVQIVAGATDIGVAVNKGRTEYRNVMSLQNISDLWEIKKTNDYIEISARVPLSEVQKYFKKVFPEMDQMLNIFASPQIKNSATLVGNVVNASPIADSIPFLMAQDAQVKIESAKGTRLVPIDKFYLGYKKLNLKSHELVSAIRIPTPSKHDVLKLMKVSLRKDLDISAVTLAIRIRQEKNNISEARIVFGGVGPVVFRIPKIEKQWLGQRFKKELLLDLSQNISKYVAPISDVRGSKEYRNLLCCNLLKKMADEMI